MCYLLPVCLAASVAAGYPTDSGGKGAGREDASVEEPQARQVRALVRRLNDPKNKASCHGGFIPGGEMIEFSPPMLALMRLGPKAAPYLHPHLNDRGVRNEVALVLGAVGDKATVPLLIRGYQDAAARYAA